MKNSKEKIRVIAALANRTARGRDVKEALAAASRHAVEIVSLLDSNRTGPQTYRNLKANGLLDSAPEEIRRYAEKTGKAAALYNSILMEMRDSILNAAGGAGIDLIPLKGISFLGRIYELGERASTDMDFLVRGRDLAALDGIMAPLGFKQAERGLESEFLEEHGGERKYSIDKGAAHIDAEFHWDPSPRPALGRAFPLKADTLWEQSREDGARRCLAPEAELLFCIHHLAAKHSFARLMWFLDIHYLTDKYMDAIDFELFEKIIADAGLTAAARAVLRFTDRYFGSATTSRFHWTARRKPVEDSAIDTLILDSLCGGAIKKSGLLPGIAADRKAAYFYYYLFPGTEFLRKRYPDTPPLLLPVLRPFRLLKKMVK